MSKVGNESLHRQIKHMYNFGRQVADKYEGGVANMVRLERLAGHASPRHQQKLDVAAEVLTGLINRTGSQALSAADRQIAMRFRSDLWNAATGSL